MLLTLKVAIFVEVSGASEAWGVVAKVVDSLQSVL
jgi:hypothetical protein